MRTLAIILAMLCILIAVPAFAGPCRSGNCQVQAPVQKGSPVQKGFVFQRRPVRRALGRVFGR
jgi:hypothetical protein